MSRIQKYKESMCKFIKEDSCLNAIENLNPNIKDYINNKMTTSSINYAILLLTTMNNQNKKHKITMQGYHIASGIELLNIYLEAIDESDTLINKFGIHTYIKLLQTIKTVSLKSLENNLESIKSMFNHQELNNILIKAISIFSDSMFMIDEYSDNLLEQTNNKPHKDLEKWYLKDDVSLVKKYKNIKQVNNDSFQKYIKYRYIVLCEMALLLGWIIGGGDTSEIDRLRKLAKNFALIIKISDDFINIDADIRTSVGRNFTKNYVANYGLLESYELFMKNKERFIQEAMMMEMFTGTIKEIIDIIEVRVDEIIDQTSPDIRSNMTNTETKE